MNVRLVLNFKGLDYTTQWVPTSDIEAVCKSLNIPPTGVKPTGEPHYTLPALIDYTQSRSHPTILSDSTPIIEYLELTYPGQAVVFPPGTRSFHALFEHHLSKNIVTHPDLFPLIIMQMYRSKVPRDQVHFRTRMEKLYGKPLEDIELKGDVARDQAWERLHGAFEILAGFLKKNDRGEFFMGERVSFSDFTLCAFLLFLRNTSPDDAWVKITSWDGGRWTRYVDACREWILVPGGMPSEIS